MFVRLIRPSLLSLNPAVRRLGTYANNPSRVRHLSAPSQRWGGPIEPHPTDNPNLFDLLISDVDHGTLDGAISKALGYEYLANVPSDVVE